MVDVFELQRVICGKLQILPYPTSLDASVGGDPVRVLPRSSASEN